MSGPLLGQLAPELREKIYRYVLDFSDRSLKHVARLQPFVKSLVDVDAESSLAYEDPIDRDSDLIWVKFDPPDFGQPANTLLPF